VAALPALLRKVDLARSKQRVLEDFSNDYINDGLKFRFIRQLTLGYWASSPVGRTILTRCNRVEFFSGSIALGGKAWDMLMGVISTRNLQCREIELRITGTDLPGPYFARTYEDGTPFCADKPIPLPSHVKDLTLHFSDQNFPPIARTTLTWLDTCSGLEKIDLKLVDYGEGLAKLLCRDFPSVASKVVSLAISPDALRTMARSLRDPEIRFTSLSTLHVNYDEEIWGEGNERRPQQSRPWRHLSAFPGIETLVLEGISTDTFTSRTFPPEGTRVRELVLRCPVPAHPAVLSMDSLAPLFGQCFERVHFEADREDWDGPGKENEAANWAGLEMVDWTWLE
jgi:hypothetical protein